MADDGPEKAAGSQQECDEIRSWLSPTNFDGEGSEYRKHLNVHVPGTGDWVFEHEAYKYWHDGSTTGGLWIQGIPGSGKSVVAAKLIETLQGENVPVSFFFARRIINSNNNTHVLVRDFLSQLLAHSANLQTRLEEVSKKQPKIEDVPFHELWSAFSMVISALPRVYIVIDALDELAVEENDFLSLLLALSGQKPASIKLVTTGRPVPHLQNVLRGPSLSVIRLTERAVQADIATYVAHRLNQRPRPLTEDDKTRVHNTLCAKVKGLFLNARLVLDRLMEEANVPGDEDLDRLPSSLEEMYCDLLHEHASRAGASQRFQAWLLAWITHATRPLRVSELADLVDSLGNRGGLDRDQDAKHMVCTACGPLLEILDDETVQVIHHSFTEFLLDESRPSAQEGGRWFPALEPVSTHCSLAVACLDYLRSGCFAPWERGDNECNEYTYDSFWTKRRGQLIVQFPFLQYAALNMFYHASKSNLEDVNFMQGLDDWFRDGSHTFKSWKDFWFTARNEQDYTSNLRPLHVAARVGFTKYTEHLLGQGHDPNLADAAGRTAMAYAAMSGQANTIELLIQHQADSDRVDSRGLAPIHHAAKGNHVRALQCLLDAGADPLHPQYGSNPPKSAPWQDSSAIGKTPLMYACELGNTDATSALLRQIGPEKRATILLQWAIPYHPATLSILLEYPEIRTNVNEPDPGQNTALYLAARARDPASVRLLLEHGANVHALSPGIINRYGRTPVHSDGLPLTRWTPLQGWAKGPNFVLPDAYEPSFNEIEESAELLINAGSDLEVRDAERKTVLFYWCERFDFSDNNDHDRIVSLLLRHGADVHATDHDGNTPLHGIACHHRPLGLLVDAGADINQARKSDGLTPLMLAVQHSRHNLKPFLECGVDLNQQDLERNTALHHLCKDWTLKLSTLETWLNLADPTIRNRLGNGHERVQAIPLLIKKGVQLESRDRRGRTALMAACENGEQHFIAGLLDNSADATATDFEGKSCLHILAQTKLSSFDNGRRDMELIVKIMTLLIERGADINATDYHGNTPFLDAVPSKLRLEAVLLLGGRPTVADNEGRTALHKITSLPGDEISDLLQYFMKPELGLDLHGRDNKGLMPIHCAAAAGDVSVQKFIEAGAEIRTRTGNGRSVLHLAAGAGNGSSLGLLCRLCRNDGWDVDERDEDGRTALHYAISTGSSECVFYLVQARADVDAQDRRGLTPLHLAAEHQGAVVASRLERKDAGFPYAPTKRYDLDGIEPLMDLRESSAVYKAKDTVRSAVGRDEDVQMIEDVVRLLISSGADPDLRDNSGWTPYDLAVFQCQEATASILQPLTKQSPRDQPLLERWCLFRPDTARQVVQEIDIGDSDPYTLLHTAMSQRDKGLLNALLEAGVDPAVTGPDALTPIHYAASWGLVSIMKTMARHLKDLNKPRPPLLHAAICPHILATARRWWHVPALEAICNAGVDLEATNSKGQTVLQCALAARRAVWQDDILDVVLGHGARINSLSQDGSTALSDALESGRSPQVIERLLQHGADINIGKIPAIFVAIEREAIGSLDVILGAGADPNTLYRPKTPLLAAALSKSYQRAQIDTAARVQLMSVLLEHGADHLLLLPDADTKNTVFHEICYYHGVISPILSLSGIDLELANGDGATPLLVACNLPDGWLKGDDDVTTLIQLILAGADIHATDRSKSTPLHLARGAFVNTVDDAGFTPLYHALNLENKQLSIKARLVIITALVGAGADPKAVVGPNGDSALHLLAPLLMQFSPAGSFESNYRSDHTTDYLAEWKRFYRRFIDKGCEPEARDNDGATPLFRYLQKDDIRDMLDTHGAFAKKNNGDTLLHAVASRVDTEHSKKDAVWLFEELIARGLDVTQENNKGLSPLDVAAAYNKQEILELYARDD
ncbi:hypothetical protein BDW74DRAFT_185125 [Aspergillus multicolor]|uniref:uncharacterized protein n=1 Tax=Aspergillus multicolor TaxID=41759 RepID=UPI003CCCC228